MDAKRILGMFNAPKEKRYKSLCVRTADAEEVWLMQDKADVKRMTWTLNNRTTFCWSHRALTDDLHPSLRPARYIVPCITVHQISHTFLIRTPAVSLTVFFIEHYSSPTIL